MIAINDLSQKTFVNITKLLGDNWFERDPDEDYNAYNLVDVELADAVILKAYTNGDLTLDLGGKLATVPSDDYYNVEII